jgi:hypothetical protein
MPLAEHHNMIKASRRIEPISRSAYRRRQSLVDQGHTARLDNGRIRAPKWRTQRDLNS